APDELCPEAGAVALLRLEPGAALLRERILNREPGGVPARDQDVPEPVSGLLLDLECLLELLLRDDAHLDQQHAQQAPGLFQRTHRHLEESTDQADCMSALAQLPLVGRTGARELPRVLARWKESLLFAEARRPFDAARSGEGEVCA